MKRKASGPANIDYLQLPAKTIRWKIITGPELHFLQMYDVVYDEKDFKIRVIPL